VSDWLEQDRNDQGFNEICEVIQQENAGEDDVDQDDDNDDESGVEGCPITHGAAADMLDKCSEWLEFQPEANLYNLTTLRELRSLAVKKRLDTRKQLTLSNFFNIQVYKQCKCL